MCSRPRRPLLFRHLSFGCEQPGQKTRYGLALFLSSAR
jgi:hypothetical protein